MAKTMKKICILLTALMMLTLTASVTAAEAVNLFFPFTDTIGESGGYGYKALADIDGNKVLALKAQNNAVSANHSMAEWSFDSLSLDDTHEYYLARAKVMLSSNKGARLELFRFISGSITRVGLVFSSDEDGNTSISYDGTTAAKDGVNLTWEPNVWYDTALVVQRNGAFTPHVWIYINGENVGYKRSGLNGVTAMQCQIGLNDTGDLNAFGYIDDMRITNISDYVPKKVALTSSVPANGMGEIEPDTTVSMTFDSSFENVSADNFTVEGANAPSIASAQLEEDGKTVTLAFDAAFAGGTAYTVKTQKLYDVYGNSAEVSVSFITKETGTEYYYKKMTFDDGTDEVEAWGYMPSQSPTLINKVDSMDENSPAGFVVGGINLTSENILFSVRINPAAKTNSKIVCCTPGVTGIAAQIKLDASTSSVTYEGTYLASYTANTWNQFDVLMNTSNQTAHVFLNGGLIARNIEWNITDTLSEIRVCYWKNENVDQRPEADDILITNNPLYFPEIPAETFKIAESVPANNSENVDVQTNSISLTFDKAVTEDIFNFITISGGETSPAITNTSLSADGKTVTLSLDGALEYKTAYTVMVAAEAVDANGNAVNTAANTITFTTQKKISTYYYDFEQEFSADLTKWGKNEIVTDPTDTNNKVGYVLTGASDNGFVWTKEVLTGKITMQLRVMATENTTAYPSNTLNPRTSAGRNNASFSVADGKFNYGDVEFLPNKWYTLTYVVDTDIGKGTMYIDYVPVSGPSGGNYADVGQIRNIFRAANSGDTIYYDDFLVTNDESYLPTAAPEIKSSVPANNAENIDCADNIITINFSKELNKDTVTTDNFVLTAERNGTVIGVPAEVTLENGGKTVMVKAKDMFYGMTQYTLTISENVVSVSGAAVVGTTLIFKTGEGERRVSEIAFKDAEGAVLTTLPNTGKVYAGVTALNDKASAADVTVILALCKGTPESYNVENISTVTENIASGSEKTITADISVNGIEGYFVKAFVWETFDSMQPLGDSNLLQ